jgi:hypothetical protein
MPKCCKCNKNSNNKKGGALNTTRENILSQYFSTVIRDAKNKINDYIVPNPYVEDLFRKFASSATDLAIGAINQ